MRVVQTLSRLADVSAVRQRVAGVASDASVDDGVVDACGGVASDASVDDGVVDACGADAESTGGRVGSTTAGCWSC